MAETDQLRRINPCLERSSVSFRQGVGDPAQGSVGVRMSVGCGPVTIDMVAGDHDCAVLFCLVLFCLG